MANMATEERFPYSALVPKKETGVTSFLLKYPEYDGRNIKIAILDSGIDPGAKGLQVTSDGKPKIIDMIDASGCGDVDTSKVVEIKDNVITGLTGRKLQIPSEWKNPSNKFHIGVKCAYELYPKQLKDRIQKLRKDKHWSPGHKACVATEQRKLVKFDEKNTAPLSTDLKLEREDIEAKIDILNNLDKRYNDQGPVYDCVVFHDGEMWRAVIDTSEKGDLSSCTLLGPYHQTFKYATLTEHDLLNYVINVYDDGNLLEIVAMSTSHGTHVASIAAANFPDNPEKNGVAPGAQVVSIGIGDGRLGSMETGSAIIRGMIKVINSKCDVINMSYGEHANWAGGRVMDIIHEAIDYHGVIMMSSAGNNGPALSTVGTPPIMPTTSIIGIGAYVSPEMMAVDYSLRERLPGIGFTWTSRGPAADGHMGVSVTAPGCAVTSVPEWTLRGSQLMNGTSMSAPHATGAVALLLSGLKDIKMDYSPYSVRRSLENTAATVPNMDVFGQGHGLLQIQKAYEHHVKYGNCAERDIKFHITCSGGNRGIYLREPLSGNAPSDHSISVEPILLNELNGDGKSKVDFNISLILECDAPYVSTASFLHLTYASRGFTINIDPRGLPNGNVYHTMIRAFDSKCSEKGPVFEVPITIIKPNKIENTLTWSMHLNEILFQPGQIRREFLYVPEGAAWAVVRIQALDTSRTSYFVLHALQLYPHSSCRTYELSKVLSLSNEVEHTLTFPVKGGGTLEIALAKWWASLGPMCINFSVKFSGLLPDQQSIVMHSADSIYRVDVMSHLRNEEISPQISLKTLVQAVRPSEHKIQPLGCRDIIPHGRQIYELVLTYNFSVCKSAELSPNSSMLSDLLYESEYESQLWMLYDSNKQLLASGDAEFSKYSVKVEKGEYTLRQQIRHEKKDLLDKMSDLIILIQQKLNNSLSLDIYSTKAQALVSGKKFATHNLPASSICPVYIAPLPADKLPKNSQPGNYLLGTISYSKDDHGRKCEKYPFKYIITEPVKKSKSSSSEKNKDKSKWEDYQEALIDFDASWMLKLDDAGAAIYNDKEKTFEDSDLPFHHARLQALDAHKERSDNLIAIVELSDQIINKIDTSALLSFYGMKTDARKDATTLKSTMDKQKTILIDTLARKGAALCDLYGNECDTKTTTDSKVDCRVEKIDEITSTMLQFAESSDSKVQSFLGKRAHIHQRYGRELKFLQKHHEEKQSVETENKIIKVFKLLNWEHCVWYLERSQLVRYPQSFRLF